MAKTDRKSYPDLSGAELAEKLRQVVTQANILIRATELRGIETNVDLVHRKQASYESGYMEIQCRPALPVTSPRTARRGPRPPTWTPADDERMGEDAACMVCGDPITVGQPYWIHPADVLYPTKNPPRVMHDRCREDG